jgi:phage shock protein C
MYKQGAYMATTKKLYRSSTDRILGGVAGGIGEFFDIDPTLIRLVIALSFFSGFGFVAYLLAWIIIPEDPRVHSGKTGADEIKEHAERVASDIKSAVNTDETSKNSPKTTSNFRFWAGLLLVFFAVSLLFQNLFGYSLWQNFWPIILVAIGVVLIAGSMSKDKE